MKRITGIICACLLIAVMVLAVSCRREEGGTQGGRAAAPERLTLWVYDEHRLGALNAMARQFEAEYGVAVDISMVDLGQIRTQFLLAGGGAECADMAIIPHDNIGPMVENRTLREVNLGNKAGNFLPSSIDAFNMNGRLWAVPLSVENIGFFYNTQLVPNPPKTWEEAVNIGVELIRTGRADYLMAFPDALYYMYPIFDAFGGSIFGRGPDGSLDGRQVLLAEPGFVTALELVTQLVRQGLIPNSFDYDEACVLFESGRAPFIHQGPWALDRFRVSGVPYAVTSFPGAVSGTPGNPFFGVQGLIINDSSPRALLAHTFAVEFLAREENMRALFNADQRPSAWRTIFESGGDRDAQGFAAAGPNAVPMPNIPQMGHVWDASLMAIQLAFSGERTPLQALQTARTQVINMGN